MPYLSGTNSTPSTAGPNALMYMVPAVGAFSIAHNLGRYPLGPTFYDESGTEAEVRFVNTDLNTFTVYQDDPTIGTVIFA